MSKYYSLSSLNTINMNFVTNSAYRPHFLFCTARSENNCLGLVFYWIMRFTIKSLCSSAKIALLLFSLGRILVFTPKFFFAGNGANHETRILHERSARQGFAACEDADPGARNRGTLRRRALLGRTQAEQARPDCRRPEQRALRLQGQQEVPGVRPRPDPEGPQEEDSHRGRLQQVGTLQGNRKLPRFVVFEFRKRIHGFSGLLAENGRLNKLESVVTSFESIMRAHRGELFVQVSMKTKIEVSPQEFFALHQKTSTFAENKRKQLKLIIVWAEHCSEVVFCETHRGKAIISKLWWKPLN